MKTLHHQIIHTFTDLSDNVGLVDLFAVVPSVQTALLLQAGEVDIPPRNISLSRKIPYHFQFVSVALTLHLLATYCSDGNDGIPPLLS